MPKSTVPEGPVGCDVFDMSQYILKSILRSEPSSFEVKMGKTSQILAEGHVFEEDDLILASAAFTWRAGELASFLLRSKMQLVAPDGTSFDGPVMNVTVSSANKQGPYVPVQVSAIYKVPDNTTRTIQTEFEIANSDYAKGKSGTALQFWMSALCYRKRSRT